MRFNISRPGTFPAEIEPAAANAGVARATDIRGQTVPDDQCPFRVEIRDLCQTAVKEFPIRLVDADLLGDEDPGEVPGDPRAGDPAGLDPRRAVGDDIELIAAV